MLRPRPVQQPVLVGFVILLVLSLALPLAGIGSFELGNLFFCAVSFPAACVTATRSLRSRIVAAENLEIRDREGPVCFDLGVYRPSSSASQVSLSGNGLMVSMAWKSRPRIASPSLAYSPSEVSRSRSTEIAGPSLSVIRTIQ